MHLDFLYKVFNSFKKKEAIIWKGSTYKYDDLIDKVNESRIFCKLYKINKGDVIALEADFSPASIALLFALIDQECIIVPLSRGLKEKNNAMYKISGISACFTIDENDEISFEKYNFQSNKNFYTILRELQHPGLVLFSSGTSGNPKAAVHDLKKLLVKFKIRRNSYRTLNFLLFDHWGGLNTMFHVLSNGGTLITAQNRSPYEICRLVADKSVELLPTSPTFLNMLIISKIYEKFNLESLKIISYGTEPMPQVTLNKIHNIFPEVRLLQTYGLIELGVLASKSEYNNSLWVKVGGLGYQTRVINGMLEIKSRSTMLGYLNAQSPLSSDGWFRTKDAVEVKPGYIKILGRKSELINVGGNKVYPQEIENIILGMSNVLEVTVYGEKNAIMGNIICSKVKLSKYENRKRFSARLKKYCTSKLEKFKVPVKVIISNSKQHNDRIKKIRS